MAKHDVAICVSPAADELRGFVATELQHYLEKLFGIRARIVDGPAPGAAHCFLLGLSSDPHIQQAAGSLPALSSQGHVVRRVSPDTVVLAGGGSAAVAWAVYELVERYGVRYLLHEDVFPAAPGPFHLPDADAVCEPLLEIRSWRQFNVLPTGPLMWTLQQQRSFIRQLFKLKFNGIYLCLWPHQPMVEYEVRGIRRQSAHMLFGQKIPIDDDTIGREHLPDTPFLGSPEFIGAETFPDLLAAGRRFVGGILDCAQDLGMRTAIAIQPLEFTREFAPLLEELNEDILQLGAFTRAEHGDLTNPGHMELARATIAAYLDEYARVDEVFLGMPEHPQAEQRFEECWQELDAKYHLGPEYRADELVAKARRNYLAAGGVKRAERSFKSVIAMLHFFDTFFSTGDLLERAADRDIRIGLSLGSAVENVLPFIDRLLWDGAALNTALDYTTSRAVRRVPVMEKVDSDKVPAALVLTFQDDNVGSLPQVATENIHVLVRAMHRLGWRGYFTRFWPVGDLDPAAAYLARASWDATVTPRSAYNDHFAHVYGETSVKPLCQAMRILEDATVILDLGFLGLIFPVLGFMKRYMTSDGPMGEGLFHVRAMYQVARGTLERLKGLPGPAARDSNLAYWISRLDFSIHALNEIDLLCQGGVELNAAKAALASGDDDAAAAGEKLALARSFYDRAAAEGEAGLRAVAATVRDDSDRSSLAAYYHFLVREVRQLAGELIEEARTTAEGADTA